MKKSHILSITFLLLIRVGFSQMDTIIFSRANNKPADRENATRYIEIKSINEKEFKIFRYKRDEDKWNLSPIKEIAKIINDSTIIITTKSNTNKKDKTIRKFSRRGDLYRFQDYFESERIKQEGLTKIILPLHLEGQVKKYYKSGSLRTIEEYKDNQMIGNKNWLENGDKYFDNIFGSVDVLPEYPEGIIALYTYISKNLKYPIKERNNGIQGRVFIHFVVNEYGQMSGAYVIKGVNKNLDQAALEVIQSCSVKWTPGLLDGKYVRVGYNLPIKFTVQ